jgi:hypothetical protein
MITLKHKRQTASAIAASNPVLAAGEFGIETDTGRMKIGDGVTAWNSLGYFVPSASDISTGTLESARLPVNAQAAMNIYLWSNFR